MYIYISSNIYRDFFRITNIYIFSCLYFIIFQDTFDQLIKYIILKQDKQRVTIIKIKPRITKKVIKRKRRVYIGARMFDKTFKNSRREDKFCKKKKFSLRVRFNSHAPPTLPYNKIALVIAISQKISLILSSFFELHRKKEK